MIRPVPRAVPQTVLLFVGVAALYASFVGYGFNLDDEGTVLYQILRTFRGERPYLDFHTGYTPAVFYLNAALFDAFGVSVVPVRVVLVVVNALSVVLIFRLALRFAPILESGAAALVYALYLPFFAGQFASFNIPYPAWYAVCAWLATELASMKAVETKSRRWLGAAGALAGVAFSFKPNTGVLALGAVVLVQLLVTAPLAGRIGALLEGAVLAVAFLAVFAVLTFDVLTEQFFLLGAPVLLIIAGGFLGRRRARRSLGERGSRALREGFADVTSILTGFALVSAVWMAYFLPRLGLDRFLEEILLLGADVERIYLIYYPDLSAWSGVLLAGLGGLWLLVFALGAGVLRRRHLVALLVSAGAIAAFALALFGLAPEGFLVSVTMQLENLSYFLIPMLLIGAGLLWLARSVEPLALAGPGLDGPLARVTVALVFALLLFLQLYPRIDFMHVVISMPSALVIAAGALWYFEVWARRTLSSVVDLEAAGMRRLVRIAVVLPVAFGLLARSAPFVDARVSFDPLPTWRLTTPFLPGALPVELEEDRDHDLRELREVVRVVSELSDPGSSVFVFPALAIVPFVTDRTTPVGHDYFFPGRPSHAEEVEMVGQIEAARTPVVVTLNDRLGYFSAAPAYYFILRDYMQQNYELVRRIGRFDVLVRRELRQANPAWARPELAEHDPLQFAAGDFRDALESTQTIAHSGKPADLDGWGERLADVDRGVRGAIVRAALGVADRHPGGLAAVEANLVADRRERLLFVRALGEYGGPSALPYLQNIFLESGERLRWEAARSINFILARRLAARFDLARDGSGPLWGLADVVPSDEMVAMIEDFVERQRIGPFAAIAVAHAGRHDLADELEYFDDDDETTWWRMVAAFSLVEMGDAGHLETLFDTLTIGTLAAQYVPSLLLDEELVATDLVAGQLAKELRDGSDEERETAAWMAAYIPNEMVKEALGQALADPSPRVRRAAAWAVAQLQAMDREESVSLVVEGEGS